MRTYYLVIWDECRDSWTEQGETEALDVRSAASIFRATQYGVVKHNLCRVVTQKQLVALYEGRVEQEDLACA